MVKCLIRIKTKVNVHLRMINHCYRDVKVRVLTLGPRLLGNVLGALPLIPPLPDSSRTASRLSTPQYNELSGAAGLESLRDSGHSTPERSMSHGDSFLSTRSNGASGGNAAAEFSEESYSPSDSVLPTPASSNCSLDLTLGRSTSGPPSNQEDREAETFTPNRGRLSGSRGRVAHVGKLHQPSAGMEVEQVSEVLSSLARLFLVTLTLLFALLLLLIALTESELDVAFLRDIRQTPEFQQFHYEYFCPLRRWLACKLRWMGGHLINK